MITTVHTSKLDMMLSPKEEPAHIKTYSHPGLSSFVTWAGFFPHFSFSGSHAIQT